MKEKLSCSNLAFSKALLNKLNWYKVRLNNSQYMGMIMSVTVQSTNESKAVHIMVSEQFDYSQHQSFRDAYRNENRQGVTFQVDLSKAKYMDSSALGMILLLKEHADELSGKVVLQKPNESVYKILMIANFDHFVKIER